ncbi:outer membrane protein assembly factor BamB, partial [Psychromonas arctica]
FSSEEDVVKMAELPEFQETYKPVIAWSTSIGSGVDKYYSQLKPAVDEKAHYVAARDGEVKALSFKNGN